MSRYLGVSLFLLAAGCASSSAPASTTAGGVDAFIGNWKASGTNVVSCFSEATVTQDLTGTLAITAGPTGDPNTITATYPDGCQLIFTVEGNTATVAPRSMTCQGMLDMGTVATSEQSITHSLTLTADGSELLESGDETVTETLPPTDASADADIVLECSWVTKGVYSK